MVQPTVNGSHQLNHQEIYNHATPTDAMAQLLCFLKTGGHNLQTGEIASDALIQDIEELMANAVPATLSESTMDQLNPVIEELVESPKKTLAKMLLNNRLRHCTVETKDGHHQPGNNFKCDINPSDQVQLQNQPLPVQLMAAWMAIDEGRSAENYFQAINALDTSSITGKEHRMLMQLLAGQTGSNARALKQQFGVDATVLARANYNTVEALTRDPQNYLTVEAEHIPTQLAQLEARLHLLLADKGLGHLSATDVLNIVIQGDRFGAFGDQKAAIQTLALNTLILTTRQQSSDKECTYKDRLIKVLNQSIEDPEEAFNTFRQCAVFLLCEMQLGGRLRPEQVEILTNIFNGQTRLAELRTGFGKTDVVLFLVALYMGQKQGVCIEMPDELLPINMALFQRKMQGLMASVWTPRLDFNQIDGNPQLLDDFLIELKTHNPKGDIMMASQYLFDQQFTDVLNQCICDGKSEIVPKLLAIREELGTQFTITDEVDAFDQQCKFIRTDGQYTTKSLARIELTSKVIEAMQVFEEGVDFTKPQREAYEIWLKNPSNVTGVLQRLGFMLQAGHDFETMNSPFEGIVRADGQPINHNDRNDLGFIQHMLYTVGRQVYSMQWNKDYGLRASSLEAVPYKGNNDPSPNENFTDSELVQWLTHHCNTKERFDIKQCGLDKRMAFICRVADTEVSDDNEALNNLSQMVKSWAQQFNTPSSLMTGVKALAEALDHPDEHPFAQTFLDLFKGIKDPNVITFQLLGNAKTAARVYETTSYGSANASKLLQSGCLGVSGTNTDTTSPLWFFDAKAHEKFNIHGVDANVFYDHVLKESHEDLSGRKCNGQNNVTRINGSMLDHVAHMADTHQLIIDCGALIQGIGNDNVADAILNSNNDLWVVFYDTNREELMAKSTKECITYSQLVQQVTAGTIQKSNIKVFVDHAHRVGLNVKEITEERSSTHLLVSEENTTRDIQQSIGRHRPGMDSGNLIVSMACRAGAFDGKGTIKDVFEAIEKSTQKRLAQSELGGP